MNWLGIELNVVSKREKLISAVGGLLAILLLMVISRDGMHLPYNVGLVASMGASAVLLFAVPHGQLSQPWPVLGGHCLAATIGVACAKWIGPTEWAGACAVALSIAVMHQLKCIHPPGGATALTAVLGGPAVRDLGFHFVYCPVFANCLVMIGTAVAFNAFFGWRRYPAAWNRRAMPVPEEKAPSHEDIVTALRQLDSFVDISEDDLVRLVQLIRSGGKRPSS
ncbi:HPP family protein [Luteolibacter flavescens]|uniref:HPP family protein n=1 Tax=Luteolibacter flavescens TaxID=1859460 RepID=A0ABT3FIX7_9BACT|nr:HPP family protein [Luteolibacter flavescens]MCW1883511.1 HPP family protein [Luteolibacter flavescens]